jgi:hypothetical protein
MPTARDGTAAPSSCASFSKGKINCQRLAQSPLLQRAEEAVEGNVDQRRRRIKGRERKSTLFQSGSIWGSGSNQWY